MNNTPPSVPSRRTVLGAAWAAPVIVVAVAAPRAAASTLRPTLSARADGPTEYPDGGATVYGIFVTNDGTEAIPGSAIVATLSEDAGYSYSGVAGNFWAYADTTDGSLAFTYTPTLPAGEESDILLLLINRDDRSQEPIPVATLTITAPGYRASVLPLEIVY